MKIKSITISSGLPTTTFTQQVTDDSGLKATYPDSGSRDVLPSPSFVRAMDFFVETLKSLGFSDYDWELKKLEFLWDKEGEEYNYKATIRVFDQEFADKLTFVRESTSPDKIPATVLKALEQVHEEACKFVGGKSAQLNFLNQDEEEAAA